MCLRRKDGEKLRIAEEDITVYKIIEKRRRYTTDVFGRGRFSYQYFTPFEYKEVDINSETVLEPDSPMSREQAERLIQENHIYFGAGFIHAYVNRNCLRREWFILCHVGLMPMHSLIGVECVIPKGEFYILGKEGDVAASKLIVRKVVLDQESCTQLSTLKENYL